MKRGLEALQAQLAAQRLDVTGEGGAVKVTISGSGEVLGLALDPALLKKEAGIVAAAILATVQRAAREAKERHEAEMKRISEAHHVPGAL